MKYAIEMGSGAMTYVSIFMNIVSGIQKLIQVDTQVHKDTHRQQSDLISRVVSESISQFPPLQRLHDRDT
jgi:hypothetical protein